MDHIGGIQTDLLVVLMLSIHNTLELTIRALMQRQRFKRLHLNQDEPDELEELSRIRFTSWIGLLQNQIIACRILLASDALSPPRVISCPWYIKPRTIEWFYLFIDWSPQQDPECFRQFFRISPNMFKCICHLVREDLSTAPPQQFLTLPNRLLIVERQVAVALRCLATGDQILGIGELFGISKQTASRCIWKFIDSFSRRARAFLAWPREEDMVTMKEGFQDRWGFPNCCGAIDVTHFPIEVSAGENSTAYYDWKHNISVTMQAVVDSNCKFLDVLIGSPGSIQDSRLLRTSGLFRSVVYDGTKLNGPHFVGNQGYRIDEYLLGDAGYPLYKWLIVPFPRNGGVQTDAWNQMHSSARMCVERAFGRLKGCWRLLSRIMLRPKLNRLAPTILTCVLLHNMAIVRGDDGHKNAHADFPAHPPGYGPFNRPTNQFFEGGPEARAALLLELTRQ